MSRPWIEEHETYMRNIVCDTYDNKSKKHRVKSNSPRKCVIIVQNIRDRRLMSSSFQCHREMSTIYICANGDDKTI